MQNQKKIGDFPMIDFFVNARIRQTRIFFKLEHLNSRMTGNNFYTAPDYPYRDFMIRFGLVWIFFQEFFLGRENALSTNTSEANWRSNLLSRFENKTKGCRYHHARKRFGINVLQTCKPSFYQYLCSHK